MKQAASLLTLLLLPWPDTTLAHTPFRRSGTFGLTSRASQLVLDALLSGGGQSMEETSSIMARGGSTRTASFAADDDIMLDETSPLKDSKVAATTTPVAVESSSRRVHEIEGYVHLEEEEDGAAAAANNNTLETGALSSIDSDKEDNTSQQPLKKKKLHLPFMKPKAEKRHKQIAKTLKNRNSVNIRRKVMHACFGLTFSLLNHVIPRSRFVPGMAILSTATLIMELLRYRKGFGWMNDALHFCLGSSLRKHEMDGKFTGSFYFFTGVTLTAYLYPGTAASLGIAQLALADPSASYFGRQTRHVYWSRIENGLGGIGRNKGWLGFLGGALFCFPFNYHVLSRAAKECSTMVIGTKAVVGVSLLLGLAGALADLAVPTPALTLPKKILGVKVPPFHVDDNMVVPIFSAFACTKVFQYYGWPLDLALTKWMVL